jgi:hypothetical protein
VAVSFRWSGRGGRPGNRAATRPSEGWRFIFGWVAGRRRTQFMTDVEGSRSRTVPFWSGAAVRDGASPRWRDGRHRPGGSRVVASPLETGGAAFGPSRSGPGRGEAEPHGCEWSKHTTGHWEAQTVTVVRDGVGGPKRAWNPATRWSERAELRFRERVPPGSGFPVLGASEGRRTSWEESHPKGRANREHGRVVGRYAGEVLEGE